MPQLRTTSPRQVAGLVIASAALLFSAAACGGGTDTDASTGDGNGGGVNGAATAYADCLKENGVTVTMPSGGPGLRPSGEPSAFPSGLPSGRPRPLGSARPDGGGFPGGGGLPGGGGFTKPEGVDDELWQKAQSACAALRPSGRAGGGNGRTDPMTTAYRNCLQDHDVTLGQGGLDTADPAVQKAVEACKALQPSASASS